MVVHNLFSGECSGNISLITAIIFKRYTIFADTSIGFCLEMYMWIHVFRIDSKDKTILNHKSGLKRNLLTQFN